MALSAMSCRIWYCLTKFSYYVLTWGCNDQIHIFSHLLLRVPTKISAPNPRIFHSISQDNPRVLICKKEWKGVGMKTRNIRNILKQTIIVKCLKLKAKLTQSIKYLNIQPKEIYTSKVIKNYSAKNKTKQNFQSSQYLSVWYEKSSVFKYNPSMTNFPVISQHLWPPCTFHTKHTIHLEPITEISLFLWSGRTQTGERRLKK